MATTTKTLHELEAAPALFEELRMGLSNEQLIGEAVECKHAGVGPTTIKKYEDHLVHFAQYLASAQDASLFVLAATTGLRLGELRALRWRDVDLDAGDVTVSRTISAGEESSTKPRVQPLAAQATEELGRLRSRLHFLGSEDHVF